MMCRIFTILFLVQLLCGKAICQDSNPANYFGLKESQFFDSVTYKLSWSSHPSESYYKEEYIPAGETIEHYKGMLMIDFLITNTSADDLVWNQVKILVDRQKADYLCFYNIDPTAHNGEHLLDFTLSEMKDGETTVAEFNIYRYKEFTDKRGHAGVLLLALSYRVYNNNFESNDIETFGLKLKKRRQELLKKFSKFPMPDIEVK